MSHHIDMGSMGFMLIIVGVIMVIIAAIMKINEWRDPEGHAEREAAKRARRHHHH